MKPRSLVNALLVVVVGFAAYKNFEKRIHRSLTADEPQNASQKAQVVVAFGDGYAEQLGRALNLKPHVLAVADETTVAMMARVGAVAALKPNYVVVAAGISDLARQVPLDETLHALEVIFSQLQEAGALVAYLPIEPRAGTGDNWIMAIEQLCKERHVLVAPRVRVDEFSGEIAADRVQFALEPFL